MFVTAALAQSDPNAVAATTASTPATGALGLFDPNGPLGSMVIFIPIIAIFYFLIFRPQQKRQRAQQEMLSKVSRGDTVVTSGGIVGKVTKAVDGEDLEVEIAQGTRVKLVRSMIVDVRSRANPAPGDAKAG